MSRFYALGAAAVGTVLTAWSIGVLAQPANLPMPPMLGLAAPMLGPAGTGYGFPPMFGNRSMGPFGQMTLSPADACMNAVAFKAGIHAYVKARLNLQPRQLLAAQAVDAVIAEILDEEREDCASLPTALAAPDMARRIALAEERLATRLRHMKKIKPAMLTLYESLSEDQRETLDQLVPPPPFL